MQISLRSQMVAGIATVGAAAMVVAPIAQPDLLPSMQRVSSAVQLTSFDNPVSVLFATLADTSASIFDQAALLDPAELFWPDSFYTPDFSFVFAPGYYGFIPDFANQVSFGGLSAVVSNLSGYVYAATEGLTGLLGGPITALTNVPFALITAAGYLAAGQPELAIAELQTQILGPLQAGITTALSAAGYIIDNVIANATTLALSAIPGLLTNVINTVVGGGTYVVQSAIDTLSTAVAALVGGQFETAWNTAVNGLLGPAGTLGQLKDLTIGIGITEVVDYGPPDGEVLTVVIPSLRSDLTSAGQRLGDLSQYGDGGIRNDAFFPEVTEPAAAVSAASAVAASQESVAVEVDRPVAGETSVSTDSAVPADVAVADTGSSADAGAATADASAPTTAVSDAPAPTTAASDASAPSKAKATRGQARGASAGN